MGRAFLVYCLSEHFCRAVNISLFPLPPLLSPASSIFRPIAPHVFVGFGIENLVDFASLGCYFSRSRGLPDGESFVKR